MKIQKPTTHMVDIGPLDHAVRLPMESRIAHGMSSRCAVCGVEIKGESFIAGFKAGSRNLMLHEGCVQDDPAYIAVGSYCLVTLALGGIGLLALRVWDRRMEGGNDAR